jgi:hypothetical protein
MLTTDKSGGYWPQMNCADFLARTQMDARNQAIPPTSAQLPPLSRTLDGSLGNPENHFVFEPVVDADLDVEKLCPAGRQKIRTRRKNVAFAVSTARQRIPFVRDKISGHWFQ